MLLVSSGRPFVTCGTSVVVDSMQIVFGRYVDLCPGTTPLEVLKARRLGAMLL